jgi:hypothetical protein
MALFNSLFAKKKPALKAQCPITKESIEAGFGYMLTTSQVVVSKKYWDMVMTEPETMSYTISHFKNQSNGTHMRTMIFEKHSTYQKPWMVSDSCISLFDGVDKNQARERAKQWWESHGDFIPDQSGAAIQVLDNTTFNNWKDYAVLEAGRNRVRL